MRLNVAIGTVTYCCVIKNSVTDKLTHSGLGQFSRQLFSLIRTKADRMNLIVWLNLLASVVLQGLFPLTVDSPVLQPSNKAADSDLESEGNDILDHVTSIFAEGVVKLGLIAIFAEDVVKLIARGKLNKTDGETAVDFSRFTGR